MLGIDLNDAALVGVADDRLLFNEPGLAVDPEGAWLFGKAAAAQARRHPRQVRNRQWSELSDELSGEGSGHVSNADLVHDHLAALRQFLPPEERAVCLAAPPYWESDQLALMLGIAQELGWSVHGLADAAIAATRRAHPERKLVHVDVSLHAAWVTAIDQTTGAGIAERDSLPNLGADALLRACAQNVAQQFLKHARFDVLDQADSEQQVYDQLDDWLAALSGGQPVAATITREANSFSTELSPQAMADAVTNLLQPLQQQIRARLPAGQPAALQVSGLLAKWPGVVALLNALPDTEVFVLEPNAAARGACREVVRAASSGDGLRLLKRLPFDQSAAPARRAPLSGQPARRSAPTHVVFGPHSYRLGDRPFNIGLELAPGEYGLALTEQIDGVSRRHCSIAADGERAQVTDHSRFGTQLNGHAINGSAVLQAGDVLSVGLPANEFLLVVEQNDSRTDDGA